MEALRCPSRRWPKVGAADGWLRYPVAARSQRRNFSAELARASEIGRLPAPTAAPLPSRMFANILLRTAASGENGQICVRWRVLRISAPLSRPEQFSGRYFVLMGPPVAAGRHQAGYRVLIVWNSEAGVRKNPSELITMTNPTVEGEATAKAILPKLCTGGWRRKPVVSPTALPVGGQGWR